MDAHWAHEKVIFQRFLGTAPELRVVVDSIRRGIGYDLTCQDESGNALAFELTEITDQDWAASLSTLMEVPQLLNRRLKEATDTDTQTLRERYRDRDIAVTLAPGAGVRSVRRVLPRLFTWLASTDPDQITAMSVPTDLRAAIVRVEPRHFPGINNQFFHVPGQAMWLGDRTLAAVRAKFEKDYPPGIGLQLLAYFHRQPARPDSAAVVRAYLEEAMPDEVIARIWLYDDQNRVLLMCRPPIPAST